MKNNRRNRKLIYIWGKNYLPTPLKKSEVLLLIENYKYCEICRRNRGFFFTVYSFRILQNIAAGYGVPLKKMVAPIPNQVYARKTSTARRALIERELNTGTIKFGGCNSPRELKPRVIIFDDHDPPPLPVYKVVDWDPAFINIDLKKRVVETWENVTPPEKQTGVIVFLAGKPMDPQPESITIKHDNKNGND